MSNSECKFSWTECETNVMLAIQKKDYSTAKDLLIKALKAAQFALQLYPGLIELVHALAIAYCLERSYAEAEYLYRNGLLAREKILGPDHPDVVDSLEKLAIVVRETQGNTALAKTIAFRAQYLAKRVRMA